MEESEFPRRIAYLNRAVYRHWHPPPISGKRVLIASSDTDLRRWLCGQLRLTAEYPTVEANDCDQALHIAAFEPVDGMLVDVDLPEMGGHQFCRLARRQNLLVPIILLSKREHSESDEILGFESGANDFLARPFALGLLLARLRARLREFEETQAAVFEVGPYRFEPAKRLLIDSEAQRRIHLTSKEAAVLEYLSRREGTSASREQLLREVWNFNTDRDINTHTVEAHVYRLRQKIERHPATPKILITEAEGYRLVANDVSASSGSRHMYDRRRAS